ncbi:carboxypeptidase regulatory-like domain-containing protein [Amycolatopsis solani]|uniref:carboxypeptidase regulatory-like domain-containing protein n=1 Tax=Amycolatopsis solani TaxID=3028615 RepID=UPI0025B12631|nr:carboxypeptidase regulatory-like domain-containing protein [Amycolatopsis sp. MEP2-6]
MTRFYPLESSVLHSPAWFVPFDEFAQRARAADVSTELERFDPAENAWVRQDTPPIRTPSAVIAYPELGRRRGPGAQPERFRVRFGAIGFAPLYPADGEDFDASLTGVEFTAYPYDDDTPPAVTGEPRVVRLLPSAAYPYGPGVRTVYGVVVAHGVPVANALVEARGVTSRDGVAWLERTLTSAAGAFRLALRWEGELVAGPPPEQVFHLTATERPGRTGALDVRLPAERNSSHVIEIVEQ